MYVDSFLGFLNNFHYFIGIQVAESGWELIKPGGLCINNSKSHWLLD